MKRADFAALLLSVAAFFLAATITQQVYEGLPHVEDEFAYIWQAQAISRGDLVVPSPICPKCFLQPFVVDHNGLRFGKYPPGWPAVLSLGIGLDARIWVNPILAALCIWFTYRLVSKILNKNAGLLAAFLTLTSPFFLVNAGTLLSHVWSYFLTLGFILAWIELMDSASVIPGWVTVAVAGLTLGVLSLTRPLTAAAVGLPFFVHGIMILIRGNRKLRLSILFVGLLSGSLALLILLWQYAVTGDPWLNPYTLWWPYDRLGFGPGVGVQPGGNSLFWAWFNGKFSIGVGASDQFGWPMLSWLFLPFGLFAVRRNKSALLIAAILPSLLLAYTLYWIGSWVFGPRYYFEGMISAVILTAAGVQWLAGSLIPAKSKDRETKVSRVRFAVVTSIVSLLILGNLIFYLPTRLGSMKNLFGVSQAQLAPFLTVSAREITPVLIIVHQRQHWREYATLLELSNPYLDTPFIFIYSRTPEMDQSVIDAFPDRHVVHYYADEPYKFYEFPRVNGLP